MADQPYKLQIKIPPHEFCAEGPEAIVKEAYDRWLQFVEARWPTTGVAVESAVSAAGPAPLPAWLAASSGLSAPPLPLASSVLGSAADRVFKVEGDTVSLRHQPPTVNKIADAAIMILYGYKLLKQQDEIGVMKLNESVRKSGFNFDRLDREIGPNSTLVRKGGQRNGARFSLNNQGIQRAEEWLIDWAKQ